MEEETDSNPLTPKLLVVDEARNENEVFDAGESPNLLINAQTEEHLNEVNLNYFELSSEEWPPHESGQDDTISVVTYNTLRSTSSLRNIEIGLSEDACFMTSYQVSKFAMETKMPPTITIAITSTFITPGPLIVSEADFLCLQEIELRSLDEDFGEFMSKQGYGYVHADPKGGVDFVKPIIFFKRNKFNLRWHSPRSRLVIAEFEVICQSAVTIKYNVKSTKHVLFVTSSHLPSDKDFRGRYSAARNILKRIEDRRGITNPEDKARGRSYTNITIGPVSQSRSRSRRRRSPKSPKSPKSPRSAKSSKQLSPSNKTQPRALTPKPRGRHKNKKTAGKRSFTPPSRPNAFKVQNRKFDFIPASPRAMVSSSRSTQTVLGEKEQKSPLMKIFSRRIKMLRDSDQKYSPRIERAGENEILKIENKTERIDYAEKRISEINKNPLRATMDLQTAEIIKRESSKRRAQQPIPHPVLCIICGDFNAEKDDPCYKLLKEGRLEVKEWDEQKYAKRPKKFAFESVSIGKLTDAMVKTKYKHFTYQGGCLKGTDIDDDIKNQVGRYLIDYIMFTGSTNSSKKAKLSLLSLRIPLSEKMAREAAETGLPNSWHPSDHLPLAALFQLPPVV
eukprot:jgi/Bigna1/85084/estExt_fgenesh1_pg.C_20133